MKLFEKKYKIVSLCNGEWFGLDEKENFLSTKWTRYRTYRFKQQAECAKLRLEGGYDKIFIYACSVKPKDLDDRIRIVDELQKLGYINSTTFDSHQKYIFTTTDGGIYSTDNDEVAKLTRAYDWLYGIYCSENVDLFLYIAAMNDRNDYMQWFSNKIFDSDGNEMPEDKIFCTGEKIDTFLDINNLPNTYEKMDIREVIKMLKDEKKL
jgi:hypothetical protein